MSDLGPGPRGPKPKPLAERFWTLVAKAGKDDCWLWQGYCDGRGRGRYSAGDGSQLAYRIAYELEIGQVPEGKGVAHRCRNQRCVNPRHLYLVDRRRRC